MVELHYQRKRVPGHVGKLVNATTHGHRWTGIHFPTRQSPFTLAYGPPGIPQTRPVRSMDLSCNCRRQHHLHMATPFTGPHSLYFFYPVWLCQGQCLHHSTSSGVVRIEKAHRERHTRNAWYDLAWMGSPPGRLPYYTWDSHRVHLRSVQNFELPSFKWW